MLTRFILSPSMPIRTPVSVGTVWIYDSLVEGEVVVNVDLSNENDSSFFSCWNYSSRRCISSFVFVLSFCHYIYSPLLSLLPILR